MIGPALGGVLIETTGLYGVYALGALLYLACVALVLPVAYRSAGAVAGASLLAMLRDAWRFAKAERLIVGTLAVTLIVNLWGFAYITMVPVIGERVLGLSPALIGALMSTEGLGAVIGALLVARYDRPRQYTRIYTASSAAFLLGVLAFALSTWFPLSVALMLFCGIGIAGFAVMQTTIVFLAAPAAVRSRVMGLLTVAIGGGPIGMLYVGVLADSLGAANAVACLAIQGLDSPRARRVVLARTAPPGGPDALGPIRGVTCPRPIAGARPGTKRHRCSVVTRSFQAIVRIPAGTAAGRRRRTSGDDLTACLRLPSAAHRKLAHDDGLVPRHPRTQKSTGRERGRSTRRDRRRELVPCPPEVARAIDRARQRSVKFSFSAPSGRRKLCLLLSAAAVRGRAKRSFEPGYILTRKSFLPEASLPLSKKIEWWDMFRPPRSAWRRCASSRS